MVGLERKNLILETLQGWDSGVHNAGTGDGGRRPQVMSRFGIWRNGCRDEKGGIFTEV